MTPIELLICFSLISFSAYLSASEIALFSLSRFQLRSLKENFRPVYRKAKNLLADPGGLLITILVINEIMNIALSTIISGAISRKKIVLPPGFPDVPDWALNIILGVAITTPIALFACEITPKVIAARINRLITTVSVGPLSLIYKFSAPIRFVLKSIISILDFQSRSKLPREEKETDSQRQRNRILKESDFLLMVEEGHKEGAIQETEVELIRNVFELDNTTVGEIATPIAQVLTLPAHTTVKGALTLMRGESHSRMPVTEPNKKDIIGILYAKDLLRSKLQTDSNTTTIATLMRKPFFVNPSVKLGTMFRKFKRQKIHMAIVKDTYGVTSGIVTMNDVLETMFEGLIMDDDDYGHQSNTGQTAPKKGNKA